MSKVKMKHIVAVTGYVPIANHPRGVAEYGKYGEMLKELDCVVQPYYMKVADTWLYRTIEKLPYEPTHSTSDNPAKNTLEYHCVQHQKFEWLDQARRMYQDARVFIWLDYAICHQPGVTSAVINDMLVRVNRDRLAIPGCWPIGEVRDDHPCWRFCGSSMVIPREYVKSLASLVEVVAQLQMHSTKNVTWEVNSLARVEQAQKLPIRWYQANHDASQFTNYI